MSLILVDILVDVLVEILQSLSYAYQLNFIQLIWNTHNFKKPHNYTCDVPRGHMHVYFPTFHIFAGAESVLCLPSVQRDTVVFRRVLLLLWLHRLHLRHLTRHRDTRDKDGMYLATVCTRGKHPHQL